MERDWNPLPSPPSVHRASPSFPHRFCHQRKTRKKRRAPAGRTGRPRPALLAASARMPHSALPEKDVIAGPPPWARALLPLTTPPLLPPAPSRNLRRVANGRSRGAEREREREFQKGRVQQQEVKREGEERERGRSDSRGRMRRRLAGPTSGSRRKPTILRGSSDSRRRSRTIDSRSIVLPGS